MLASKKRTAIGVSCTLVRYSVGIEETVDLLTVLSLK